MISSTKGLSFDLATPHDPSAVPFHVRGYHLAADSSSEMILCCLKLNIILDLLKVYGVEL